MTIRTSADAPGPTVWPASAVGGAASMLTVGSLLAGYRIEQVLATGATATVYLAQHPTLPRRDALKVLNTEVSHNPAFRERFVREADIASVLTHPNIVSVHNRGEAENGQLWIAMHYVAGTDAEAAIQAATMTPARALRIATAIAHALDYAHQHHVVHHDVKPGNVLLANDSHGDEHVFLSDFGVARALRNSDRDGLPEDDSTLAATLAYAAPEVITGAPLDGRADIYSLGCTLFRMLTGRAPFFRAEGTVAVAQAHLHQRPPRISDYLPGATRQLDVVMARALAKNPSDRFGSAREFTRAAAEAWPAVENHPARSMRRGPAPRPTIAPPADHVPRTAFERQVVPRDPGHPAPAPTAPSERRTLVLLWAVAGVLAVIALVLWVVLLRR